MSDASFRLRGIVPPKETFNSSTTDGQKNYMVTFSPSPTDNTCKTQYNVSLGGHHYGAITGTYVEETNELSVTLNDARTTYDLILSGSNSYLFTHNGSVRLQFIEPSFLSSSGPSQETESKVVKSVMPGIIEKVLVKQGDPVKAGDPLVIMIAMKMEYTLKAGCDGTVTEIIFTEGNNVPKGAIIIKLE